MQRRNFITAAAAASAFGILRKTASAADPIRTAMIGTGNRGSSVLGVIVCILYSGFRIGVARRPTRIASGARFLDTRAGLIAS